MTPVMSNDLCLNDPALIHLWHVHLKASSEEINNLKTLISTEEKQRAERFAFDHLQRRYIITRGRLRQILGQYLNLNPQQISFKYSDKGKPFIPQQNNPDNLQFNLSHSEDKAIYGIRFQGWIGVDIEKIREIKEIDNLTKRFFCSEEFRFIQGLKGQDKQKAFFQIWTAKEAYLKGIGVGISGGLTQMAFTRQGDCVLPLITQNYWDLLSFPVDSDYVASIAFEGQKKQFSIIHWNFEN